MKDELVFDPERHDINKAFNVPEESESSEQPKAKSARTDRRRKTFVESPKEEDTKKKKSSKRRSDEGNNKRSKSKDNPRSSKLKD